MASLKTIRVGCRILSFRGGGIICLSSAELARTMVKIYIYNSVSSYRIFTHHNFWCLVYQCLRSIINYQPSRSRDYLSNSLVPSIFSDCKSCCLWFHTETALTASCVCVEHSTIFYSPNNLLKETVWVYFQQTTFWDIFLFLPDGRSWHFMRIVFNEDNSRGMSNPVFSGGGGGKVSFVCHLLN